ncbi:MAG: calcium-binding protein, partial [Rhodobacter sp.]|nr:calcium-binding protein [Rhodobacter sp.]
DDWLRGGTLADTFVFAAGADQIDDFNTTVDLLKLDDALWAGAKTAAEILAEFGGTQGSDYVLGFGGGNSLTFNGGVDPEVLENLISFF